MKYIKGFNESIEGREEIEELSQLCFANLLDEDFKVTIKIKIKKTWGT